MTFTLSGLPKKTTSATFSIGTISGADLVYQPAAAHNQDGESGVRLNPTSITVYKS